MSTLTDPIALATKVALGTALALLACRISGNTDGVSAAFVAVLCTTPTVLSGLQQATTQFLGSLIGGVAAAAFGSMGLPVEVALPVSVGLAVGAIFPLGHGHAYAVAAFTAIYMHLLPHGSVGDTLAIRIGAVAIGGASAALVNVTISAAFYERIFARRVRFTTDRLAEHLQLLATGASDADGLLPVFPLLRDVAAEVSRARHELRWRRSNEAERMENAADEVRALTRLAHFARDLGLAIEESGTHMTDRDVALVHYAAARLRRESAPRPKPEGEIGQRLLAALDKWEANAAA
ncbi:MAG: hypothetical protein KC502_08420 [Myxococcales bacterium]|nr:hypothetical protein [Myxococcales bacterium]